MKLTDKDIQRLKNEKRTGFIFSELVLAMGGLFSLIYWVINPDMEGTNLLLMDTGVIGVSILVSYFMNKQYNKDLNSGTKIILMETVQGKENHKSHKANSGAMYIPILGDLFPKLFGQKMQPALKLNLIINGYRFEVEKNVFDEVKKDDLIEMHYTIYSEIFLGIELIKLEKQEAKFQGTEVFNS